MDRNTVLAIVLSAGFLLLWFGVVLPRLEPGSPPFSTNPTRTTPVATQPLAPTPSVAPTTTPSPSRQETSTAVAPRTPLVVLETPRCRVELTARGAAVVHWMLKERSERVELVRSGAPVGTWPEVTFQLALHEAHRAVWTATLPSGLQVTKTYELNSSNHLHRLLLTVHNPRAAPLPTDDVRVSLGPGLGTTASEEGENPGLIRALSLGNGQFRVHKPGQSAGAVEWVALDNRYFLAALIPSPGAPAKGSGGILVEGRKAETTIHLMQRYSLAPGETSTLSWQLYMGPKGYTQLRELGLRLEEAVDFGWMGVLGKLALHTLYVLHRLTGNYGWAIVLLTMGLQILLIPLALKSLKATLAMKALQPQVKALQERFKGDPKRLNVEMMHLYKQSGTNPLKGCLPMVLQLPIFWALFTTLRNAYELRGAPFIGWIRDLSMHDPYYALPILMGLGMFVQQRMSSVTADPTQRQMMYIMPVIFTFMFLRFPAGLVLYWLVNSLLTMIEQWGLQRWTQKTRGAI